MDGNGVIDIGKPGNTVLYHGSNDSRFQVRLIVLDPLLPIQSFTSINGRQLLYSGSPVLHLNNDNLNDHLCLAECL